jgi:hypothetical protein
MKLAACPLRNSIYQFRKTLKKVDQVVLSAPHRQKRHRIETVENTASRQNIDTSFQIQILRDPDCILELEYLYLYSIEDKQRISCQKMKS